MDNQVAVKAVIRLSDGRFLIVKEGDRWQGVGGRLEKGETLEEGLRREAEEETGITDLAIEKVIHVDEWFSKPEGELKHIVAIFFLCHASSTKVSLSSEHQDYAWVLPQELDKYGDKIEKEIKKAIMLASK
ncbi:MAG: NUDIX domain-containing protein [Candidatus Saccharimonadales bacterium]